MTQIDAPPDAPPDTLLTTLSSYDHVEMGTARSLPLDAYTSQDLFDAEIERVFRNEWICVGREEQIRQVGDWFSADIAGEPVVVTRNEHGEISALSGVCRHRYMTVAQGAATRGASCVRITAGPTTSAELSSGHR